MRKSGIVLAILFLLTALLLNVSASAAADGYYHLSEVSQPPWDATLASRLAAPTNDYDYAYGDDESVSFNLPWNLNFYGQSYSSLTADTNGNIWFGTTGAAYAVDLVNTGRGPVISAWNDDLSSSYYGGVFIQHKTDPERVVIEWQTETYTEEGLYSPNNFLVVLYPDGTIRNDYKSFTTQNGSDAGSGISRGDGSAATNLTAQFGSVIGLAGRSFQFAPQSLFTVTVAKEGAGTGTVTSNPVGVSCGTVCSGNFPPGTTVALSATPGFGSTFDSWGGACTGTDPCTLTLDSNKSVLATFDVSYAPAIIINSPSGALANSKPVLNYAVSTGTTVVKVDGSVVGKASGDTLDNLADGPHVVRVEATNAAGHLGFAESSFTIDTTSPALATLIPAAGSGNVPVRMSILVQFSEQVDPTSVTTGMASLVSRGLSVPGDIRLTGDGRSLIFKPQGKLAYASSYSFTLKAGVRDLLGNTQKTDLVTAFSTSFVDPDLVGYWPMDGDWNDYSVNANNARAYGPATFVAGRVAGVSSANFAINSQYYDGSGGDVPAETEYVADAPNTFSISFWAKPNATRASSAEDNMGITGASGQRYAVGPTNVMDYGVNGGSAGVSVGTNGISVIDQTGMDISTSSTGVTGANLPSLLVYDAPAPLSGWNHIVVVFNNKQPSLYLNGVFIRTGQASPDATIYPSAEFGDTDEGYGAYSGQLGEVAIFKRALSAGEIQALYQVQNLALPQMSITSPGQATPYKHGDAGSATVSVASTTGITGMFCSASGATADGGLAVTFDQPQLQTTQQLSFDVSADAAPYAPIVLSCVALDVNGAFGVGELTLQAADQVPPTIVSTIPLNNAADVSATKPVIVTFSESMDRASIVSRSTFMFQREDSGAWVEGRYAMSTDGTAMMLVPTPALDPATSYTVRLSGVRDLAGNSLLNDYLLRFTTEPQPVALALTNQGSVASPYVLPSARYGTLALSNSFVSISGGVTVDSLAMDNSTLNVSPSATAPGNLSIANGDMVLTGGSQVNIDGTLNLAANLNLTASTMALTGTGTVLGGVAMSNSTVTLKSPLQVTGDVTLRNNSVLTHFAATVTGTSKLDVTAANMIIDATSKIDVSGRGYLGGFQPGTGITGRTLGNTTTGGSESGSGGSYGGIGGGGTANAAYGDPANPNELGSGGGGSVVAGYNGDDNIPGGNGGGLIRLKVATLSLDGQISADGVLERNFVFQSGGGSGGGIRIDAGSISGSGIVSAKGGTAQHAFNGGGGGRIAIYYGASTLPVENVIAVGGVAAGGGASPEGYPRDTGGAGTIYLKRNNGQPADLIVNNGGIVTNNLTPVSGGNYNSVTAGGGASFSGNYTIYNNTIYNNTTHTFSDGVNLPGDMSFVNSVITVNGPLNVNLLSLVGSNLTVNGALSVLGNLALDGSSVTVAGAVNVAGMLTLVNGSVLSHLAATTATTYKLSVSAAAVSIDLTSKIDVSGKGYPGAWQGGNASGTGMSLGNTTVGGSTVYNGGSYGGLGGYSGTGNVNASYGSMLLPGELGSGGGSPNGNGNPGGNGGGVVLLTAGTLDIAGAILADGGPSNGGGGGSGGGILLTVGTLSGAGTISSRGSAAGDGAGGGGRIAIYYDTNTLPSANIMAAGGSGNGEAVALNGGAGTIYLKDNAKAKGDVIVKNGGVPTNRITTLAGGVYELVSFTDGAKVSVTGDVSFSQDIAFSCSDVAFSGGITTPGNLTFNGSSVTVSGPVSVAGNLTLDGSSVTVSGPVNVIGVLALKNNSVLGQLGSTISTTYKLSVTAASVSICPARAQSVPAEDRTPAAIIMGLAAVAV
jgi:hypothetical protein